MAVYHVPNLMRLAKLVQTCRYEDSSHERAFFIFTEEY